MLTRHSWVLPCLTDDLKTDKVVEGGHAEKYASKVQNNDNGISGAVQPQPQRDGVFRHETMRIGLIRKHSQSSHSPLPGTVQCDRKNGCWHFHVYEESQPLTSEGSRLASQATCRVVARDRMHFPLFHSTVCADICGYGAVECFKTQVKAARDIFC